MKKETRRRMYFWHAKRHAGNGFELASGELLAGQSVHPGFFEDVKKAIAELCGWPINSFSVVSLSFLGEYEE